MAGAIKNPFDFEGGDLTIVVMYEGKRVTGKVSTSAMMLASPVWKKFIYPPWTPLPATDEEGETSGGSQKEQEPGSVDVAKEMLGTDDSDEGTLSSRVAKKQRTSQGSKSKELDFTEDNGEALLIILNIVHLQFDNLPTGKVAFSPLFEIARLCDMYDCAKLVKSWVPQWYDWSVGNNSNPIEQRIHVLWAFGTGKRILIDLTVQAIKGISVKPDGGYRYQLVSWDPAKDLNIAIDHLPPKVLQVILSVREETLRRIFDVACQHVKLAATSQCALGYWPACPELMYGSLTLKLQKLGLWPPPVSFDNIAHSIWSISLNLLEVPRTLESGHGIYGTKHQDHRKCRKQNHGLSLHQEIDSIIEDIEDHFDPEFLLLVAKRVGY